jgi:hypothetical protein
MFDATSEYVFKARTPEGEKAEIVMRWPNDQEWGERKRAAKLVTTQLGRGRSETQGVSSPETDLKIFDACKLNGAPKLEGDEATRLLDVLARCEVRDVEIEGPSATVTMQILGGEVKHMLRVPTAKQARLMREAATKIRQMPHNRIEVRMSLDAPAKLWEECGGKSDDYKDGIIPALHKDVAIRAVIEELDNELASALEETDDF